jgi:hypothetical protein
VHFIHVIWFKTLHKTSFLIFDVLLIFCPNDKIWSLILKLDIYLFIQIGGILISDCQVKKLANLGIQVLWQEAIGESLVAPPWYTSDLDVENGIVAW